MLTLLLNLLATLRSAFRTRADLALENLALRQQLASLSHDAIDSRASRIVEHRAQRDFIGVDVGN